MSNYLDIFISDFYSFERLATFILAVQKFKPECISALKNMRKELSSVIEENQKELSSLYYSSDYELSLSCIDFMKDNSCDMFLHDSARIHYEKASVDISNLEDILQSRNLTSEEIESIKIRIEKIKETQKNHIEEQKEKLKKITEKIKERNSDLLKLPIPHPFRMSDLVHEYDFPKIIAWYYFITDRDQLAEKLQSSQTDYQEKIDVIKKYPFFFTQTNEIEKEINEQHIIAPDNLFNHRRLKHDPQVSSKAIGEIDTSTYGYTVNINSTIKVSDTLQINEQELILSVKRAIYISLCENIEKIAQEKQLDFEKLFSSIDSIEKQEEKDEKRFISHITKIINGLAIVNITTYNNTIESSINILMDEFKKRFNEKHRLSYTQLDTYYQYAVSGVNKYELWFKTNGFS
jgi:hypothetical protein